MEEQLTKDLKQFEQLRFEATLQVQNPGIALVNYHRADAVAGYIRELQKRMAAPPAEETPPVEETPASTKE